MQAQLPIISPHLFCLLRVRLQRDSGRVVVDVACVHSKRVRRELRIYFRRA